MKVFFSTGKPEVLAKISGHVDSVDFFTGNTIDELINLSISRRIFFDRIVFSEKVLQSPKEDLEKLLDYLDKYSSNTSVVVIMQKSNAPNLELFTSLFNAPIYTPVLIEKASVQCLIDFIKEDIPVLKAKYYSLDVQEARAVSFVKQETSPVPNVSEKVEPKKQSGGFFKKLFGKREIDVPAQMQTPENTLGQVENLVGSEAESIVNEGIDSIAQEGSSNLKVEADDTTSSTLFTGSLDDPFDLSLGSLGEQHVDTGFLDEDELEEYDSDVQEDSEVEEDSSDSSPENLDEEDLNEEVNEEDFSSFMLEGSSDDLEEGVENSENIGFDAFAKVDNVDSFIKDSDDLVSSAFAKVNSQPQYAEKSPSWVLNLQGVVVLCQFGEAQLKTLFAQTEKTTLILNLNITDTSLVRDSILSNPGMLFPLEPVSVSNNLDYMFLQNSNSIEEFVERNRYSYECLVINCSFKDIINLKKLINLVPEIKFSFNCDTSESLISLISSLTSRVFISEVMEDTLYGISSIHCKNISVIEEVASMYLNTRNNWMLKLQ